MQTIYSKIIWEELGLEDYKIHLEDWKNTEKLIIDWIKNTPIEKVDEVLSELSWINRIEEDAYYDGHFHVINQYSKEEEQILIEKGKPKHDLIIHDSGLIPSFLNIAIKCNMSSNEIRFMADLMDAYHEKFPKKSSSCSISTDKK